MFRTVLLALLLLVDSKSRAHAHALLATSAATGGRGLVRPSRGDGSITPRAISSAGYAARADASLEAKWYRGGNGMIIISASVLMVTLAVLLLRLL